MPKKLLNDIKWFILVFIRFNENPIYMKATQKEILRFWLVWRPMRLKWSFCYQNTLMLSAHSAVIVFRICCFYFSLWIFKVCFVIYNQVSMKTEHIKVVYSWKTFTHKMANCTWELMDGFRRELHDPLRVSSY